MEKLMSFCRKAFSYPSELKKTHPLTAIMVVASTIMFALYAIIEAARDYGSDGPVIDAYFHISLAAAFFAVFIYCLESIRPGWSNGVKIIVYAVFGLLSLFMSFINSGNARTTHGRGENFLVSIRASLGDATVVLYTFALLAIAALVGIYFSYSHDIDCNFNTHFLNANAKIFFSSIIYGVIQLGVLFLTIIVTLLLYDDAFSYLPAILILINGLFLIPAVIVAVSRKNEDANTFFQIIVRYVMLIITLIAFAIIYIYMIKLVVTASVPSNSVYAILTALFLVSMYVSYMCTAFEDKGFLQKFAYNSPLVFAPFILMQCYTVFVRIGQYGLTPKRYFGIAFILFEIVYIVYYTVVRKREKEIVGRSLLLIICSFLSFTILIPGVNARSLSTYLCRRTLASYIDKAGKLAKITDEEYMRANAAYGFLSDDDFGGGRLAKYFPEMSKEDASTLHELAREAASNVSKKDRDESNDTYLPSEEYGWYSADLTKLGEAGAIDIAGKNKMTFVRISDKESAVSGTDKKPVDTKHLGIYATDYKDEDKQVTIDGLDTVDLSDFCRRFNELAAQLDANIIVQDDFDAACRQIGVIDINENVRLYITNADISRNASDECLSVSIEGFFLYK